MADWVIVVDDDESNLKMAGHILSKAHMRVTAMKSGRALLDYMRGRDDVPDLILLDLKMPEMDGSETLKKLREQEKEKAEVPVVFLTADDVAESEENGFVMGVSDYIKKPIEPGILIQRIQNVIQHHREVLKLRDEDAELSGMADKATPDLKTLSESLSERNVSHFAMWMGQESFGDVYRYMMRYIERYHGRAFKLLFSAKPNADFSGRITDLSGEMQNIIQHCLRSSDFMMQTGELQFFLFLPEVDETGIEHVINRIMGAWDDSGFSKKASLTYESENVRSQVLRSPNAGEADHIVVVDDDATNLKFAKIILSKADMRVTALKSGKALLDFLKLNRPDLILLDVKMPEMDGFDTLRKMRRTDNGDVPVIFLTADENYETETKCLTTGAVDFIKKPFVPEILKVRVRHNVELNRLQKHLEKEVTYKTEEVEKLSINIVKALAEAIDAKDAYTNGHSSRVAEYSREIARRYGYSEKSLEEIYMMGLLHDVGKIGVPDAVINKPAKLTDEEYDIIKNHPVLGARILGKIKEMPSLQMGARWHHERFDGHGYPDGLAGENIPEEARIIAVADAYDAMTSHRSYREPLPQGIVRGEIEKGMGTQFDPHFAKIMLEIMDEDTEYRMKEE